VLCRKKTRERKRIREQKDDDLKCGTIMSSSNDLKIAKEEKRRKV